MASYTGLLDQQILVKIDEQTKQALADEAERRQSSLSVVARQAIRAYLAECQQAPMNEVQRAS